MSNRWRTTKPARIKACELAVDYLKGEDATPARLFATILFFETYIERGVDATEEAMHILRPRKIKNLKVIAGGEFSR